MQAPRLYGSIKRLAALRAKAIKDEGVSEKQRRLRDAAVFLRNTRQCMIDDCSERTNGDVNVLDSILAPHLQEYEQHVDKDTAAAGNTEERMLKALRDAGYRWVYEVADYMGSDHVIAQEEQYSHVTTDKLYLVNQGRLDVVFDNPGSDSGNLRPGAVLLLPPKRQFSSLEVVKDGDTFWRFAQVHAPGLQLTDNAALYRLLDFNPQFDDCNAIYAGDIIYIPTSSQQQHRDGVPRDQQPARSPVVDGAQDAPRDQPRTRSLGAAEIAQLARQEGERVNAGGSVYELIAPDGDHTMDFVLFHGLQPGDYTRAYLHTWQYKEGNEVVCSLPACLATAYPGARVLSVTYDSSAVSYVTVGCFGRGRYGWEETRKLLASHLQLAGLGCKQSGTTSQGRSTVPIVFVGHSLGGLIMQQVLLGASKRADGREPGYDVIRQNIRGMVYYATPHGGSQLADVAKSAARWLPRCFVRTGRMLDYLTTLSKDATYGLDDYESLIKEVDKVPRFETLGFYELQPLASLGAVVVPFTSARIGMTYTEPVEADHMEICKPSAYSDIKFVRLKEFVNTAVFPRRS